MKSSLNHAYVSLEHGFEWSFTNDPFLVIMENQSRPRIHEAEISALLNSLEARYAVLVALVAGQGYESVRP
jgi:hypothetical protein